MSNCIIATVRNRKVLHCSFTATFTINELSQACRCKIDSMNRMRMWFSLLQAFFQFGHQNTWHSNYLDYSNSFGSFIVHHNMVSFGVHLMRIYLWIKLYMAEYQLKKDYQNENRKLKKTTTTNTHLENWSLGSPRTFSLWLLSAWYTASTQ